MRTDLDGAVVWKGDYAPFGETLEQQPVNWGNPYTFLGNEDDGGLMDFGARFYDPLAEYVRSMDLRRRTKSATLGGNHHAFGSRNRYNHNDNNGGRLRRFRRYNLLLGRSDVEAFARPLFRARLRR
jgi:hypothetical protein